MGLWDHYMPLDDVNNSVLILEFCSQFLDHDDVRLPEEATRPIQLTIHYLSNLLKSYIYLSALSVCNLTE